MILIPLLMISQNSERVKTNFNSGWRFQLGHPEVANYKPEVDDTKWELVNVPHPLELTTMDLNGYNDDKYQDTFMRKVGWSPAH